ncbi:MAG: hypothetical protein KAS23_07420 [Anaerohalosphaera sp.]|nr:hypothetical protein [Anaerohalosphaera sp.]
MKRVHLAVLKRGYVGAILAGRKVVELRLMRSRRAPYGRVSTGDEVFIKESCGPVAARAVVGRVVEFEGLTRAKVRRLHAKYNELICGADEYWDERADCKYACVIWLEGVEEVERRAIDKSDQRAWVVLSDEESFGLL